MNDRELIEQAKQARKQSYSPYSGFAVGAALLAESGRVYLGCNIESAALSPTVCAERVAFFRAIADGERAFSAIAVVGAPRGEEPRSACPPCGVCRQVMAEHCAKSSFRILLEDGGGIRSYTLGELYPEGFYPEKIAEKQV